MDKISSLHDSVLVHIVSSLEMKDAVKTGALSKRWKTLWTQVYNISFSVPNHQDQTLEHNLLYNFVSFVDHTLLQCVFNIKKFSLTGFGSFKSTDWRALDDKLIDNWVDYVSSKKVEILNLDTGGLQPRYCYRSGLLFQCSSLTQVELSTMDIKQVLLLSPVNWPLLKSLSLFNVYMEGTHLENILLGCPMLDTLSIQWIWDYPVRILSSSLKELTLVDVWNANNTKNVLEIRAPSLRLLKIRGIFCGKDRVIIHAPSLVKSTLDFGIYSTSTTLRFGGIAPTSNDVFKYDKNWCHMGNELVKSLCQVGELLIGSRLLQALSWLGKPCVTFMCKHLKLYSPLWKYDISGMVYLLEGMPHLDTLRINVSKPLFRGAPYSADKDQIDTQMFSQLSNRNGRLMHLKKVTIDYYLNPALYKENAAETELIGYLLRSCVALEKLVICSTRSYCCNYRKKCLSFGCAYRYLPQLYSKLIMKLLPANKDSQFKLIMRTPSFEFVF